MQAILIKTNNEVIIGDFTFEQMRNQFKSGYAEAVKPKKLDRRFFMVIDDEGLLNGSPQNIVGCYLYETEKHGSPIVGDIFICADAGGDFGSLSNGDAQKLKKIADEVISNSAINGSTLNWKR